MSELGHILERFFIHFFCGTSVFLLTFAGIDFACRKLKQLKPLPGWWAFIVPGVLAPFVIFLREPFDILAGGPLVKSYADFGGWLLGIAAGAWGIYRLTPRFSEIIREIQS